MPDQQDICRHSENAAHHVAAKANAKGPLDAAAGSRRYHETVESALADGWDHAWYGRTKSGERRVYAYLLPYRQRVFRAYFRSENAERTGSAGTSTEN